MSYLLRILILRKIYTYFISIVLIRLYSNKAFKMTAAILSDATIDHDVAAGICNMKKEKNE